MQITKVELKNIKNHAEASWEFEPGVVAICGPNGAGKTTILEAIAWALFDHLDYKREDFVKRGAKRGQVVVSFISNADQREYEVYRDTAGGYSVFDPVTKARLVEQRSQVVPWLKQQIRVEPGVDLPTLFKSTVGVPQGTFTADFTLPPTPRKKVFDQILKVEEYREASDNLKDTQRHLTDRSIEADRRVAAAEGELKVFAETEQQHAETAARRLAFEAEQSALATERDQAAAELERLSALQQQIGTQRGAVERAQNKLSITRDKFASTAEAAKQAQAAAEIVAAARTGYEKYQAAARCLTELEGRREQRDRLRSEVTQIERERITAQLAAQNARAQLDGVAQARSEFAELSLKVDKQVALETEIARLRESRGEAQGLQHAVESLDRELGKLRDRYGKLSREAEAAETHRPQAERVDELEASLRQLDEQLQRQELVRSGEVYRQEHLQRVRGEVARLSAERDRQAQELARLESLAAAARQLVEIEARHQAETDRLAQLKAEVARDAEMIAGLEKGGVCPLLTEKCLNLKPGESLDQRFRTGLVARRAEIAQLAASGNTLVAEVRKLRTAEAEAARLPKLREEAALLAATLAQQEQAAARIKAEFPPQGVATVEEIRQFKERRDFLAAELRAAREAQRQYGQAEVLRRERDEVKREGESKKREYESLKQKLDAFATVAAQLAAAETALRALSDPRSRAAVLQQTISRESEWRCEAEQSERQAQQIGLRLDQVNRDLQPYAQLDLEIGAAHAARVASESDYHAFIANEKVATTRASLEAEAATLAAEITLAEAEVEAGAAELKALEGQYDAARHGQVQARLNQLRERLAQVATQLEHTREQHARLQQQLAHLTEVRERMRVDLALRDKLSRLHEASDFIRDTLQKAAPFITESYLYSISIEANQLFREITGRYDVTLKWDKDYEILLEEEGRTRPFANLSGGEQMAAALAVRLALLKELSEINIAFFDEPTTNMDEERRRNLAQQIGRIKDFNQLFVISHDDSFESFTDQVVMLGERAAAEWAEPT